jgi:thioredoxin reductase (NADPH)
VGHPEEWLYPQVQDALSAWTIAHRSHHVVYRIVGEQWERRSHDLRDILTRNGVPFEFYPVNSAPGQRLAQEFQIDSARLPAVKRVAGAVGEGSVTVGSVHRDLADAPAVIRPSAGPR